MIQILAIYFILATAGFFAQAADFLTDKPAFLTPCPIHTYNVDPQCLPKNIENIFVNWKNGIPGLKAIGAIDPFKIKRLRLSQRSEGVADVQLELKNALISGMANAKVLKSAFDPKDYTFSMQLKIPASKLNANYILKGRILVLNLDGRGQLEIDLKNVEFSVIAKTNLVKRGQEYFFDIQSLTTDVSKIGGFKIHLSNLFNGNKELEDSAHELFNSSWELLFNSLRPGITRTFNTLIKDRYTRIYSFVPARYFVSDLP